MDHLEPIRRNLRYLAALIAAVSAALTFAFGLTMATNLVMAVLVASALAGAAIGSAYIWPLVLDAWAKGNKRIAIPVGVIACLFTVTDLTTNFGSLAWQRGGNIDAAKVQSTRYEDSREQVEDNKANLKLWKDQLAKLSAENAWTATVTAAALRSDLEPIDEKIRQEAARGGCGPKCLALKEQKAAIEARIAIAEARSDLTSRIEATQRLVDKYREHAATVETGESGAHRQNLALASMFTLSLEPSAAAEHWTDKGIGWLVAAFLTFGALGLNLIAYSGQARASGGYTTRNTQASNIVREIGTMINDPRGAVLGHYGKPA